MNFLTQLWKISGVYFYFLFIVSFLLWSYIFYIILSIKFKNIEMKSAHAENKILKKLNTVFFLAGIAPLIGLLGTIDGIVEIFKNIWISKDISPSIMASGIGLALATTQTGLVIAIPGIAAGNFIKGKYCPDNRVKVKKGKNKLREKIKGKNIVNDLNLTPLLDMVFILLIFFVVTSSFIENHSIDLNLPGASTGQSVGKEANFIVLNKNNQLFLNSKPVSYGEISLKINELEKKDLIISADKNVAAGKLIELIDFLRKNKISSISVSVENEE
ncbi:MAG: biopolymer transporter ExbD [Desulforegulaceae bacterium]|nr:biopolymer transporter ExbD [Desulforegulaceae bacterium]